MTLLRDADGSLKREAIYQHFPGYLGIGPGQWRTTPVGLIQAGDWKLMEFFEDGRLELYNLRDDIGETNNLADADARQSEGAARETRRLAPGHQRPHAHAKPRRHPAGRKTQTWEKSESQSQAAVIAQNPRDSDSQ